MVKEAWNIKVANKYKNMMSNFKKKKEKSPLSSLTKHDHGNINVQSRVLEITMLLQVFLDHCLHTNINYLYRDIW